MIIWVIGMSASGKTVVAKELYKLVKKKHKNTVLIDGDIFRGLLKNDLGHSIEGRKENSDRISRMCQFLDSQGIHVVCAILSLFPDAQQWNRDNYPKYYEVFLNVPFNILLERDPKGLYKKALGGEMPNMVGVDIKFIPPANPNITIFNDGRETPQEIAARLFTSLKLHDAELNCS